MAARDRTEINTLLRIPRDGVFRKDVLAGRESFERDFSVYLVVRANDDTGDIIPIDKNAPIVDKLDTETSSQVSSGFRIARGHRGDFETMVCRQFIGPVVGHSARTDYGEPYSRHTDVLYWLFAKKSTAGAAIVRATVSLRFRVRRPRTTSALYVPAIHS